jgi:hypothetical protein
MCRQHSAPNLNPLNTAQACPSPESPTDDAVNTGKLCNFSCGLGYRPASHCSCTKLGHRLAILPPRPSKDTVVFEHTISLELGHLCKLACHIGYCPESVCLVLPREPVQDKKPDRWTRGGSKYDETALASARSTRMANTEMPALVSAKGTRL